MTDRFDLEQKIMKMFDVVEDIHLVNSFIDVARRESVVREAPLLC